MELTVRGARVLATTGGRDLDPSLPLLIFVHGAAADRTVWQLQTRYFAHHGYSVLAVDLPRHGGSNGELIETIEAYADWLVAAIIEAGYDSAHLVGHSMGSLISLESASRHPERVKSLVLAAAASAVEVHPALMAAAENDEHLAFELLTSWSHGRWGHLGGHRTPGLWMLGSTMRLWERARAGVLVNDLRACDNYANGALASTAVRCPTLMVNGQLDTMTPSDNAQPLRDNIAGIEEIVIEGAGHAMIIESPDPVIDAIAEFLGRR